MRRISVIDSHTAGEPTRVAVAGGPDLGAGSVAQRLAAMRHRFDRFRSAVVNEPRGSDVMVGGLLLEPEDPSCAAGVIFFNNVGYLGMCGHGTIGLVATLAHLGRVAPGVVRIETPVGVVVATLQESGEVSVENVPSYRKAKDVRVHVDRHTFVSGDVAWGGNWFFLCEEHRQLIAANHVEQLTKFAWRIRRGMSAAGFPEVDHIELLGPPATKGADARNFVLCPGGAYDRSPCGTGTSAKLACLAADGKLAEDQPWVQESILGTRFIGRYRRVQARIIPTITGRAYVNGEATLVLDYDDPFCWGIRPPEGT